MDWTTIVTALISSGAFLGIFMISERKAAAASAAFHKGTTISAENYMQDYSYQCNSAKTNHTVIVPYGADMMRETVLNLTQEVRIRMCENSPNLTKFVDKSEIVSDVITNLSTDAVTEPNNYLMAWKALGSI